MAAAREAGQANLAIFLLCTGRDARLPPSSHGHRLWYSIDYQRKMLVFYLFGELLDMQFNSNKKIITKIVAAMLTVALLKVRRV